MFENFKTSINHLNKLNWIIFSICLTMILIDPVHQSEFSLFGIKILISRTLIVAPLAILLLTIVRGIIINNSQYIVEKTTLNKDKILIKKFILSSPLLEFLRWKSKESKQAMIFTIIQSFLDAFPSCTIASYPYLLEFSGYQVSPIYKSLCFFIGVLTAILGVKNYSILRRKVYEILIGPITTPD